MPLGCDHTRELLPRLLDGDLPQKRAAEVTAHLVDCAGCRAVRDENVALATALRAHVAAGVEQADFGRLWSRIEAGLQKPAVIPLGERLRVWLAEIAAAYRAIWITSAVTVTVVLALVMPAWLRTTPAHDAVSIESIETAEAEGDGGPDSMNSATTTIYRVPDGKGGITTVIWVTEPESADDPQSGVKKE